MSSAGRDCSAQYLLETERIMQARCIWLYVAVIHARKFLYARGGDENL